MNSILRPQTWTGIWQSQTWKVWVKWLVILGVLGMSFILAWIGTADRFTQVLMLAAGLLGAVILLQWPALGLFGVLLGGFFVSYSGPGGLNAAVMAVAGITGIWIVDMVVRQRKLAIVQSRLNAPIIIFIIASLISFGMGQLPWYPLARHAPTDAQFGGLAIFILSALALLVVGNLVRDIRWLQAFTWLFICISAVYIVARLVPPIAQFTSRIYQSGATVGSLFWVWLLVIPFSQALLNKKMHKAWRAALAVLVAASLYVAVVMAYDWKSGFIPPLAGIGVIVALLLGRRMIWFFPALAGVAVLASIQAIDSDQYSWITRLEAWRIVTELSMVSPLFGIGFSNYYWYTPLVPILGWHVQFNSHGQYIDIFSQTGLVGLIAFFWIFWELGKLGMHLKDRVPEGFARAYVYGALGGLAGTLVAGGLVDWILPFVYNIGMNGFRSSVLSWMFLGGLVAIHQIAGQIDPAQANNASTGREQ